MKIEEAVGSSNPYELLNKSLNDKSIDVGVFMIRYLLDHRATLETAPNLPVVDSQISSYILGSLTQGPVPAFRSAMVTCFLIGLVTGMEKAAARTEVEELKKMMGEGQ